MQSQTAIESALKRAGADTPSLRLRSLAADALKHCKGNTNRALDRLLNAVKKEPLLLRAALRPWIDMVATELPGNGQFTSAEKATHRLPLRQPDDAAGSQLPDADNGQGPASAASVRPETLNVARNLNTDRYVEPTEGQVAAAVKVRSKIALTILDTYRIDGRPIGDWQVGEAMQAARRKTHEGRILQIASRWVANADPSQRLRDIVKADDMNRIIQLAAEAADANAQ